MDSNTYGRRRCVLFVWVAGMLLVGAGPAQSQDRATTFAVPGDVALQALMSLSENHLQQVADLLSVVAATQDARTGGWDDIRPHLALVSPMMAAGVVWFVTPDGGYWTLDDGRAARNLTDRPYFPSLMAGERVMGHLVISRATGRSSAIVAVPVYGPDHEVIGALGSSVYLDDLSARIKEEMGLQPDHLFYSLDSEPKVGLHLDPEVIFLYPLEEGDRQLERSILEMLSREEGSVTYSFHGRERQVLYRHSPVTGWWYAFGEMRP